MILGNCEKCPLRSIEGVTGEGPDECDYVFVGMAPEKNELEQGRPFVGLSGFVIRETLEKLKFPPFYITNTLLCKIPDSLSDKDEKLAIACCKDRLLEEIRERKPKVVVALGNMPLRTLTGKALNVTEHEGRVLDSLVGPLVPVTHPASFLWDMLRAPDRYPDFVDAIRASRKWVKGTYIQVGEPPDSVVVDRDNYSELLSHIERSENVVVDLETTGSGFYPYNRNRDKIRCIAITTDSMMQGTQESWIVPAESSPYFEEHPDFSKDPRLKRALEDPSKKLIFHNCMFDQGFLWANGFRTKVSFDTFLAHYMLDEREYAHGLKPLARKYYGAPEWEEDIKIFLPTKKSSYDLIPDDRLYEYAKHDTVYTYMLFKDFSTRVGGEHGIYHTLLMPCANMFTEVRNTGLRVDVGYLAELDNILDEEYQAELTELQEMCGYYINPNSSHDVQWLLFDMLGYPPSPKFGRSTRKNVLETMKDDPIVDKIMKCRAAGKLRSTYVSGIVGFLDYDYMIHPLTKLHGAKTGRISTEDPSVMNITGRGGIKKLYLPLKDDHLLCEADGKQMELRCYSVIADDRYLAELLLSGDKDKDPHEMVRLEASARSGRNLTRTQSKSCVFGRLYGRHASSFERALGLDKAGVHLLLTVIDSLFPTIPRYNKEIKEDVHQRGKCVSYFNRVRRFPLITLQNKNELYRQGANFKVQSMASDINLFCMLHLFKIKNQFGIMPMFPVHDSIVMDLESVDAIPELRREMEAFSSSVVENKMTFKYDFKAGPTWGDAKEIKETV